MDLHRRNVISASEACGGNSNFISNPSQGDNNNKRRRRHNNNDFVDDLRITWPMALVLIFVVAPCLIGIVMTLFGYFEAPYFILFRYIVRLLGFHV